MNKNSRQRMLDEETANIIIPAIGIVLSLVGLIFLVVFANLYGDVWHIVSCSVYGATLIVLYTASTLYHSFRNPRIKHMMQIFDHSSIYLLIAGTYTPFTLVNLRGDWGWSLFGVIWGLALLGIIFKFLFVDRFKAFSTSIYLLMGWIVVIAIKPMLRLVPIKGIIWLIAGGLSYTIGVVFFTWDYKIPYGHTIWHLFVLVGAICHFWAIILYVIPY